MNLLSTYVHDAHSDCVIVLGQQCESLYVQRVSEGNSYGNKKFTCYIGLFIVFYYSIVKANVIMAILIKGSYVVIED